MPRRRTVFTHLLGLAVCAGVTAAVPIWWCGWDAKPWFDGDLETQKRLARGVERLALGEALSRKQFKTGSELFNGEWLFGTYQMAALGFGQMAVEHPELREEHGKRMSRCIERLLTPEVRAFDKERWREDPIDSLDGPGGHAAYLGYLNLVLSLHRQIDSKSAHAELNDRITAALIRRIDASRIVLLETYPVEHYPVDNCFVIGSIGLHAKATGRKRPEVIDRWVQRARERWIDRESGLLIQAISPSQEGTAADAPRGSGTALGVLALHYADEKLARELFAALKNSLATTWLGFGAMREYPEGQKGRGDIDSGPVVFGYGLSATGFAIGGARRYGDEDLFRRLYASAHLCGAPIAVGDRTEFVTGGSLGNAIMFAMLTTPKLERANAGEAKP